MSPVPPFQASLLRFNHRSGENPRIVRLRSAEGGPSHWPGIDVKSALRGLAYLNFALRKGARPFERKISLPLQAERRLRQTARTI